MSDLISTQEAVAKIVDTAMRNILSGEQKLTKEYEQSVKEAVNVILDTAKRTDGDLISRQAAIDALDRIGSLDTEADKKYARSVFEALPSAQPEITYQNCSDAMLKMWMDNVLTDGEYNRIMDKLNKFDTERKTDE